MKQRRMLCMAFPRADCYDFHEFARRGVAEFLRQAAMNGIRPRLSMRRRCKWLIGTSSVTSAMN
jgi:hypothetical protein